MTVILGVIAAEIFILAAGILFYNIYGDSALPAETVVVEDVTDNTGTDGTGTIITTDQTTGIDDTVHTHLYNISWVEEPTCTAVGERLYQCDCGDYYYKTVDALGHMPGDWVIVKAATTAATGLRQKTCTVCGETLQSEVIASLGSTTTHTHAYVAKVTRVATCALAGITTYTCTCGSTYTESIPVIPHTFNTVATTPDCYKTGSTSSVCKVCGYVATYMALPINHTWGAWKTTEATATTDGVKQRTCSVCAEVEKIVLPKTGSTTTTTTAATANHTHYYREEISKYPTCTEAGEKLLICACGDKKTVAWPAAGHISSAWVVVKKATTISTGLRQKTCTVCGEVLEEEVIPMVD